jgi:maltose O-acetyltransferase
MKKCGKNLQVQHDSILRNLEILEFGSNVFIGNHAFIMGSGSIILENDVMIAPHSVIIAGNHTLAADGYRNGPARKGTIIIKRGSWIAANCTVAIGAVLPEMSVLGANSMLNKAFDTPSAIYAGVPAKLIKVVGQ